jgi:predicted MPP superfamily phosphohydrolase
MISVEISDGFSKSRMTETLLYGPASISLEADEYRELGSRLGQPNLSKRMNRQAWMTAKSLYQRRRMSRFSDGAWKQTLMCHGLRAVGLYGRGYSNYQDVQIRRNAVKIAKLPQAFDGYRILHISDLHIDLDPALTDVVLKRLADVEYDLCVITGDFRSDTIGPSDRAITETIRVIEQIDTPIYATLGNHDFIESVLPLEQAGVQFLLNEAIAITREGESLYLSGIDDSYTYQTDDLPRASRAVPTAAPSILLSHTPDVYRAAAAYEYDLMLCGHTHAGQICLPGGIAIQRNSYVPRNMLQGTWRHGEMAGYTSSGTGSTSIPIRFFCPPEITIHVLQNEDEDMERAYPENSNPNSKCENLT